MAVPVFSWSLCWSILWKRAANSLFFKTPSMLHIKKLYVLIHKVWKGWWNRLPFSGTVILLHELFIKAHEAEAKNWKAQSSPYHSSSCKQPQRSHNHLLHAGTSKNNAISWHVKMYFNILKKLVPGEFLCFFPRRANAIFADEMRVSSELPCQGEKLEVRCKRLTLQMVSGLWQAKKGKWETTSQKLCSKWPQLLSLLFMYDGTCLWEQN